VTTTADEARAAYDRACACDREGLEAEAIPHYEEALRLGLDEELLPGALLGLGSSLRNVGRHTESVELLTGACERFPDDAALRLFRALSLASAGRCDEALGDTILLAAAQIDRPEIHRYRRALDLYAEELAGR
jgi:tetratricopeptide (TPR) repeat protein